MATSTPSTAPKYSNITGKPLTSGYVTTSGGLVANKSETSSTAYKKAVKINEAAQKETTAPYQPNQYMALDELGKQAPVIPTTPKDTTDYTPILKSLVPAQITTTNPVEDSIGRQADMFTSLLNEMVAPPNTADIYNKAQKEVGLKQKQQQVNDLTAQLNQITAQSQASQLAVTGQGRGIPEAIIGGQQAEIAKEAAIRALPISASLQAVQGNLEMAQQNLNTLFTIRSSDAQAQYQYKNNLIKSVYDFASGAEKTRLDYQLKLEDQKHQDEQTLIQNLNTLAVEALKGGAPASVLSKIAAAKTVNDAIKIPGLSTYFVDKKKTGSGTDIFTQTQLNTGASNAGIQLSDFENLDTDVQNYYIHASKDQLSALRDAIANGDTELIDTSNLPDNVKTYFKSLITTQPKQGSSLWDAIKSIFSKAKTFVSN